MNGAQKRALLDLARRSLTYATEHGYPPPLPSDLDDALMVERGAFVTLHTAGQELRGCIGNIVAEGPLAEVVNQMAAAAALRDPRFAPVTSAEAEDLEIEISVLGPLEPVESLADVEVGRHGLLVTGQGRRGVLLPQVATEYGWDTTQFAEETCRKAGLPRDTYARGRAKLWRFSSEVFDERLSS